MKATTVRPEIGALIFENICTILTFPGKPRLDAGSRLLIHAGAKLPGPGRIGEWHPDYDHTLTAGSMFRVMNGHCETLTLHTSAILGSVRVEAVVPIHDERTGQRAVDAHLDSEGWLFPTMPLRWAVLVSDPRKVTDQCPWCDGSALVGLCGRTDNGSDGPCVLRPHHANHPCYGEGDVAGDWGPAASCRRCCVCACGSCDATRDPVPCHYCGQAPTPGKLPAPIPCKGRAGIWTWTP